MAVHGQNRTGVADSCHHPSWQTYRMVPTVSGYLAHHQTHTHTHTQTRTHTHTHTDNTHTHWQAHQRTHQYIHSLVTHTFVDTMVSGCLVKTILSLRKGGTTWAQRGGPRLQPLLHSPHPHWQVVPHHLCEDGLSPTSLYPECTGYNIHVLYVFACRFAKQHLLCHQSSLQGAAPTYVHNCVSDLC